MPHQSFGLYQDVFQYLHGLRILKCYMFSLIPSFIKMLIYKFPKQSPLFPIIHHCKRVPLGDEIMSDIRMRSVAINGRFLVKESFYNARIIDYNRCCRAKFERKYRAVFLGPVCKSGSIFLASVDILNVSSLLSYWKCTPIFGI